MTRPQPPLHDRELRNRALVLPLIGALLLLPPMARAFLLPEKIAGIPFTLVYLFAVWAGLIAGAALLGRPLADAVEPAPPGDNTGDEPASGG